jgi:hypothetical protein
MKEYAVRVLLNFIKKKWLDMRAYQNRLDDFGARHALPSAILSIDDELGQPTQRLLDICQETVQVCRTNKLPDYSDRFGPSGHPFFHRWPGEHYRVLAAICKVLKVRNAIEIGTYTGLGSLAILPFLPDDGSLVTFDIMPWEKLSGSFLRMEDFSTNRFRQVIADLSDWQVCRAHEEILQNADLIFLDAAKDGFQEQCFLDNFEKIGLKKGTVLVFDDTKIWNMLGIWRKIIRPKIDFTSFGHFTGTGIMLWE